MKVLNNLDLTSNQLLNAKLQNLGADLTPGAGNTSTVYYNTSTNQVRVSNGASIDTLTNILESVTGSGAISVSAVAGKSQTISIAAATGSVAGTMSASDFSKLAGATASNTGSTIVMRDASGNFSAGTITATLTGTASNATTLNSQAASFYLSYANFTGTTTHVVISDFDTQVRTSRLDQMAPPTASVSMNSQIITSLGSPVNANDAATKAYVDASAAGWDTKASVRVATTAALPTNTYAGGVLTASATGALSVDGVAVATGDRVLVKNEATTANNGLYVVTNAGAAGAAYVLTRSSDANTNSNTGASGLNPGSFVFVEAGTQAATAWEMTTTGTITIGTTAIVWTQVGGAATYSAGVGLTLAGSQFSAVGTANRIAVSGSGIDIAATYVGQTSITTLGTIATGTWQGTTVGLAFGGTGATTAAGARTALGAITKYVQTLATSATSYTVSHSLGTQDVDVIVREVATNSLVMVDAAATDTNTVTLSFATAPAANAYRVTVFG